MCHRHLRSMQSLTKNSPKRSALSESSCNHYQLHPSAWPIGGRATLYSPCRESAMMSTRTPPGDAMRWWKVGIRRKYGYGTIGGCTSRTHGLTRSTRLHIPCLALLTACRHGWDEYILLASLGIRHGRLWLNRVDGLRLRSVRPGVASVHHHGGL